MSGYGFQPVDYRLTGGSLSTNSAQPMFGQNWGNPQIDTGKVSGFGNMVGDVGTGATADPTFMQGMLGYTDSAGMKSSGWGTAALGIAQGVGNAFMGMKQYGLAKAQFDLSKESFDKNYAAQRQSTNTNLEDRQRARVASNPGAYESVGSYMNKNGIA